MNMIKDEFNHLFREIRDYLDKFSVEEDALQKRMREQSIKDGLERWIIPAEVGRFFFILTQICKATTVYEVGSYLGYSATWFGKALPDAGKIFLTENNEYRYSQAKQFLENSSLADKVVIKNCDAHEDLKNSQEKYDIILIDHDKPNYSKAYFIAKNKIKKGGLIIADNVLWRNRIVMDEWNSDPSTKGVLDFNKVIMSDPDVTSLIIPIGDGVSLSYFQ